MFAEWSCLTCVEHFKISKRLRLVETKFNSMFSWICWGFASSHYAKIYNNNDKHFIPFLVDSCWLSEGLPSALATHSPSAVWTTTDISSFQLRGMRKLQQANESFAISTLSHRYCALQDSVLKNRAYKIFCYFARSTFSFKPAGHCHFRLPRGSDISTDRPIS